MSHLQSCLELEILIGNDKSDLEDIIQRYATASRALDSLLSLKIDFETYCDILESLGLGMDDYIETVQDNLDVTQT